MRVWFGLYAADGDQGVRPRLQGIGDDVFELAQLVAAIGEAGIAILALGIDLDPAPEMGREPLQWLDRRGAEGQGIALEFLQHRVSPGSLNSGKASKAGVKGALDLSPCVYTMFRQ